MSEPETLHYAPDIAAKAVVEITNAMRSYRDMDYAKALISDPRMTSNMGLMASCGLTTREIKRAKECMKDGLPTLEAQRRAIQFLNQLDVAQGA
jgi:hypothetical protein